MGIYLGFKEIQNLFFPIWELRLSILSVIIQLCRSPVENIAKYCGAVRQFSDVSPGTLSAIVKGDEALTATIPSNLIGAA